MLPRLGKFGAGLFAALVAVAVSAPAQAAPAGAGLGSATLAVDTAPAAEKVHYRGYRHCHWRNGYRRCHGGYAGYNRGYYGGYSPGFSIYIGPGGRYGNRHRHHGYKHHRKHR